MDSDQIKPMAIKGGGTRSLENDMYDGLARPDALVSLCCGHGLLGSSAFESVLLIIRNREWLRVTKQC